MPRTPDTKARKQPLQRRSKETVGAIIGAAARILRSRGVEALDTNEIARVAGVSIGSLYQYFPSKEAIVGALIEHQLDQDERFIDELLQSLTGPFRQVVPQLVHHLCAYQLELAPLLSELLPLLATVQRDALVLRRMDQMSSLFRRFLQQHLGELDPALGDPERLHAAVMVQVHAARGVLNTLALLDPRLLQAPMYQAELTRLLVGLGDDAAGST